MIKLVKRKYEINEDGLLITRCFEFCTDLKGVRFWTPVKRYSYDCVHCCKQYYAHNKDKQFVLCKK
jgi:hypothetical protein